MQNNSHYAIACQSIMQISNLSWKRSSVGIFWNNHVYIDTYG